MADSWEPQAPPVDARTATPDRRGFPLGLTIATAIALVILMALGSWQVQRLHWKNQLLAQVAALAKAPARPLEPVLDAAAQGRNVDFTRVSVTCEGLAGAPYVEIYSIRNGQAGSRLISACQVASRDYRTILIDRGFVADSISARPAANPADKRPLQVVGVLRAPDAASFMTPKNTPEAGRFFSRDVAAMAQALNAPQPAPVFLFAETHTSPGFGALQPSPLPAQITNRHLEYALTWFGLAAALVGVYAAVLLRRRKI